MNTHETYVSLETAELLKKAGFDWETIHFYNSNGIFVKGGELFNWNSETGNYQDTSTPTLAVAQKWLREVKGMPVNVISYSDTKTGNTIGYCYQVYERTTGWVFNHFSYESALEAGIKKALEIILEKEE